MPICNEKIFMTNIDHACVIVAVSNSKLKYLKKTSLTKGKVHFLFFLLVSLVLSSLKLQKRFFIINVVFDYFFSKAFF
jgi:hypothetical protein